MRPSPLPALPMTAASCPPPARRIDLDWVRILAFALLILYHVGMYYVSWGWHVKSPHASTAIEPLMLLSAPWRLGLLFFVSGCATAFLHAKAPASFVGERTRRLLIPLAFGIWVVVPPQSWAEVAEAVGYDGGYLRFWQLYASGYGGFCREDCLRLPTWNHLWFVAYLWCYTMLAALAWRVAARRGAAPLARAGAALGRRLRGAGLLLWPVAWLALARIALVARFPATHALVDDWYDHALYMSLFAAGLLLARDEGFWGAVQRQRWLALAVALACWAAVVAYFGHFDDTHAPPAWLRQVQRVAFAADQWCAIVAVLGFARRWNPRDSAARRYLTEAVFPFYIVHQTAIVLFAHALKPLALPPVPEAALLVAATVATCFASFELVRRVAWLRPLFGLGARHNGPQAWPSSTPSGPGPAASSTT
jgi:peptidoglycan/LPS O-acetylase OafA/YrhL